ncbi:3-methyladenine DNA glycosylase [Nitrosophilus kaiyonis]|uniref:3-methyladenine DNA glycosylase n=1 Tax=Nitrosophilus kaiyonis TaxID=2930200 RepID=UPI00248FE600|nr:3-methyladenine DNA glycosylase [Nitrosophilus kaiyonis]
MLLNSFELLKRLKSLGYIKDERDPFWWPNSGSFEVVIGAILTQNTKWEKVELALSNLKKYFGDIEVEKVAQIDQKILSELIKPAGFYNTKAFRIKKISQNILNDFESFENFQKKVSRYWLLNQKGIGKETADSILNYACYKDFMVVDSYTARILKIAGYEFEDYDELQDFLTAGIFENLDKIYEFYNKEIELNQIYARFHGKIVDFCKEHYKGKNREEKVKKLLFI